MCSARNHSVLQVLAGGLPCSLGNSGGPEHGGRGLGPVTHHSRPPYMAVTRPLPLATPPGPAAAALPPGGASSLTNSCELRAALTAARRAAGSAGLPAARPARWKPRASNLGPCLRVSLCAAKGARLPSPAAQAKRQPSTRRHCSTAWACCTCYLTLTRPTAGARQSAVCVVSSTRREMPATRASRSGRPRSRLLICTNVQACMGVHASPSFSRLSPCRGAAALPACSLHEQPRSAGERISACRTGKHARCAARQAVW